MKRLLLYLIIILQGSAALAQDAKSYVNQGNNLYLQKKYQEAEIAYRKAAAIQGQKLESNFKSFNRLKYIIYKFNYIYFISFYFALFQRSYRSCL